MSLATRRKQRYLVSLTGHVTIIPFPSHALIPHLEQTQRKITTNQPTYPQTQKKKNPVTTAIRDLTYEAIYVCPPPIYHRDQTKRLRHRPVRPLLTKPPPDRSPCSIRYSIKKALNQPTLLPLISPLPNEKVNLPTQQTPLPSTRPKKEKKKKKKMCGPPRRSTKPRTRARQSFDHSYEMPRRDSGPPRPRPTTASNPRGFPTEPVLPLPRGIKVDPRTNMF